MEGIHSYEQRSTSDLGTDGSNPKSRLIIVNRREPKVSWSTPNHNVDADDQASGSRSEKCSNSNSLCWLSCCNCRKRREISPVSNRQPHKNPDQQQQRSPESSQSVSNVSLDIKSRPLGRLKSLASGSLSISSWLANYDCGPFPSNELRTSKYTVFNFLPKNLFEQFRRLANFYFLITAILQLGPLAPIGPITSIVPLFFVVSTTAIKQAYEDYLRHKLDREVNNRLCQVFSGGKLIKTRSKDIRVGDIVYVRNNEEIPCDMILLASGGPSDNCHITTANLDGETNLKTRTCFAIRDQVGNIDKIDKSLLVVECEQPNATLYEFNGLMRVPRDEETYRRLTKGLDTAQDSRSIQLEVRRRGGLFGTSPGQLRNMAHVQIIYRRIRKIESRLGAISTPRIGAVNQQTQQQQSPEQQQQQNHGNQKSPSSPPSEPSNMTQSYSDCYEIPLDLSNLLIRASRLRNTSHIYGLAIYTGRDTKLAHNSHVKPNKFSSIESKVNLFLIVSFFILVLLSTGSALNHWNSKSNNSEGPEDSLWKLCIAHFLLYNYMIPISLYVTLEFVKFIGSMAVVEDKKMRVNVWRTVGSGKSLSHLQHDKRQQTSGPGNRKSSPRDVASNTGSEAGSQRSQDGGKSTSGAGRRLDSMGSLPSTRHAITREGPKCNSSDLNEELGQVEVLFSDKTGTLTENRMLFTAFSTFGSLYRVVIDSLYHEPAELGAFNVPDYANRLAKVSSNRHAYLGPETIGPNSKHTHHHNHRHQDQKQQPTHTPQSSWTPPPLNLQPPQQQAFDHRKLPPIEKMRLVDRIGAEEQVTQFFVSVCLCSTINLNESKPLAECLPDKQEEEFDFQSASPDEESLISAAHSLGITLCKSSERECFVAIRRARDDNQSPKDGSPRNKPEATEDPAPSDYKVLVKTTKNSTGEFLVRHFKRLLVLEFNSSRKRMSVIYEDCDLNQILMVTKGSEEMLDCIKLPVQGSGPLNQSQFNQTLTHFEAFAKSGLRTMLVARKLMERQEFERISSGMRDARALIQNREYFLDSMYRKAESNLQLIGATAVEDTLQEGVPETISNLREAGIKIWLLTGDKVETAVSVAYLCRLLDRDMHLFHVVRQRDVQACQTLLASYAERLSQEVKVNDKKKLSPSAESGNRKFALVADGRSLYYAMKYARDNLAVLCKYCACILGCRLSPIQKAEIVAMIKADEKKPITAAIGDGANDVSMIQEAHVGIGVFGKEGRQAVNSCDFAISRFNMLNRLLFVHGHLFYHRTAQTILFFFYKNLFFIIPQFLFSFYSLSWAESLHHPIALVCFNLIFTSFPIIIFGLYEMHLPDQLLESEPQFYKCNRGNRQLEIKYFVLWILCAILQGLIAFYALYLIMGTFHPADSNGDTSTTHGFSFALELVIVATVSWRLYMISKNHSWIFYLSLLVSCLIVPTVFACYSYLRISTLTGPNDAASNDHFLNYMTSPICWLSAAIVICAAILPDILTYVPSRISYFRWINSVIKQHNHNAGEIPRKTSP